ncbi:probable BOI-related E3 ubiquitin- ligase 2 [Olea europaea subsp. europaea]|uniref:Probable BOI-related E3 ubiquitin- ligase 2 n=1 Tax=Olea europaea subsp. europaea TaxID=158383 RepID=A0A8S0RWK6_OLEEU|nr:probable BOI-related E3 ubiquitin- ligase 2 [Olea europaea subsp. europaea]
MATQVQCYLKNLAYPFGGTQDLAMDNTCGLNQLYSDPQQQFDQNFLVPRNDINHHQTMDFSHSLGSQIEKQRVETDRFICLQNEQLRLALQQQRKQQIALFIQKYEPKIQLLLKQKDEEISKAVNRKMELEDFLRKMEIENQRWHGMAKENEAAIRSLNNAIQQIRESACLSANEIGDAESFCNVIDHNYGEEEQMICRSCKIRNSCVIILPCRHLCSCKDCEVFLNSCPICKMVKKASIEALI